MHFISAPWRSSGKTLLTLGLARVARRRGHLVQTFKKGPDFIDPLWLASASGRACYNLDPWMQPDDEWRDTFARFSPKSDAGGTSGPPCVLVEGTMGLHDGLASDGSDSNAAVAKALGLPVLLVVDCHGMHRTVAALLQGIERFDPALRFSGLILNRIRSERHAGKLRRAIEQHSDLPLLGELPECSEIRISEKELGLVPAAELSHAESLIDTIADLVCDTCDVDRLLPGAALDANSDAATSAPGGSIVSQSQSHSRSPGTPAATGPGRRPRIGIARDAAFHFYYADDLATLRSRGAELVELSPIDDAHLPEDLDALILGGGFPERFAESLSMNHAFRNSLRQAIEAGLVVHAECGGLMYLCNTLSVGGTSWPMVGVIDADATMQDRPVGRGYMHLSPVSQGHTALRLPAHEFHHSTVDFHTRPGFAYRVARGYGVDGYNDGIMVHNVIASYAHLRHTRLTPWVDWLLARLPGKALHSKVS